MKFLVQISDDEVSGLKRRLKDEQNITFDSNASMIQAMLEFHNLLGEIESVTELSE